MSDPHKCDGSGFHTDVDVMYTDLKGTEWCIVAYCDSCRKELTCWIDIQRADAWFEAQELDQ